MILIVDRSPGFHDQISALYDGSSESILCINDISSLDETVAENAPDVVIIGPSVPIETTLEIAKLLSARRPEISIIIAVEVLSPELLRDAMRAGVKDIIERGASDEQAISTISRALGIAKKLKGSLNPKTANLDDQEFEQAPRVGKVVTFFSTKGGVGKSVTSTNIAVALAKLTGRQVVILDLDLQFGDVAIMLQMVPSHTIYDVVQAIDRLDGEMLQRFLTTHSSGIKAMLAPARPHESDLIMSAHIKTIVTLLKEQFDYVVIDLPSGFNDIVLTALDISDQIYLVASMEMPSIKNIKLAAQTLGQLGYSADIIKFVLNRADSKVLLEISEVEKSLGMKTEARIPSDRIVPRSINIGTPVVIEEPKSTVAKSFFDLAEKIEGTSAKARPQVEENRFSFKKLTRRLP